MAGEIVVDTNVLVYSLYLLTEDLQDGQVPGRVRVINPFRVTPGTLAG
jgi:predicted nucleic acid-binding protein